MDNSKSSAGRNEWIETAIEQIEENQRRIADGTFDKRKEVWERQFHHAPRGSRLHLDRHLWESLDSDCAKFVHESRDRFSLELAVRSRLAWLGRALESGGSIHEEAAQWLGYVLVEIARGERPEVALGLTQSKGRPKDLSTKTMIAGWMAYLVHRGLSQNQAAEWIADYLGLSETREIQGSYRDLKARRGTFKHVQAVRFLGLPMDDDDEESDSVEICTPWAAYSYMIPDRWVKALGGGLKNVHL